MSQMLRKSQPGMVKKALAARRHPTPAGLGKECRMWLKTT
jgi:hypothetical protein